MSPSDSMTDQIDALDTGALFSPCRRWRYILWRRWDWSLPVCAFIGLNPSTADEMVDDPTIRRCLGYAKDWGYGQLLMLNIFAFRATDPRDMKAQRENAIGPRNNEYLFQACRQADLAVAAWGAHGSFLDRADTVQRMLGESGIRLHVLKLTQTGAPGHPLYLRRDLKPMPLVNGFTRRLSA